MKHFIITILLLFFVSTSFAQMRLEDRVRIKEAKDIAAQYGNQVWEGIGNVPFILLLVTDSTEYLINHPNPSSDFRSLPYDSLLNNPVYSRNTQFNTSFLATFPAVNGVNCIVVGTPENTGKNSTEWIITLLHEHFHQFQYNSADYYLSVDSLNLAEGDQTGMWMLNYPFPYSEEKINNQFRRYSLALAKAVEDMETPNFENSLNAYFAERNTFRKLLDSADYRYFSFQVWQEGIARYSEYKFLEIMDGHHAANEIEDLPDFVSYTEYKTQFFQDQLDQLKSPDLARNGRVSFYPLGYAEGVLLDKLNPLWRVEYLSNKFYLENYFERFKYK